MSNNNTVSMNIAKTAIPTMGEVHDVPDKLRSIQVHLFAYLGRI